MHFQMGIKHETVEQLERLLKELRLAHVEQEIELKKLLHKCTASGEPSDIATYNKQCKAHRAQGAKLTVTNVLRVVLAQGLMHPKTVDALTKRTRNAGATSELLKVLNKVGVARGYGSGTGN